MALHTIYGRQYDGEDELVDAIRTLVADEQRAGRPIDPAVWNALNESLESERAARNVGRRAQLAELARGDGAREDGTDLSGYRHDVPTANPYGQLRERALRVNERADFLPERSRAHMEQTLREDDDPENLLARFTLVAGDRAYFRAFAKWLNDPMTGGHEWTNDEREAVQKARMLERAMAIGSGGAGGFLVPYELDPSVILAGTGSVNPMRQVSRVVTTAYNEKRFVTSTGVTAHMYNEGVVVSDDSPTLLQPAIVCRMARAYVPVSYELYEDSDIAGQIGTLFADAKDQLEATEMTLGTGSAPDVKGIITAISAVGGSTIATGTNTLAQADLYANQAALPARWRPNARWMMNLSVLNGFRQLPQATGLNYSIVNDNGPRPTILGWPVYENSLMDGSLTSTSADYVVLSGDFNQYAIVDRVGVRIELIPNVFDPSTGRPTGQRGFHQHWRFGADALVPDAFRLTNYSG